MSISRAKSLITVYCYVVYVGKMQFPFLQRNYYHAVLNVVFLSTPQRLRKL